MSTVSTQYRGFQIIQENCKYKVAGSVRIFTTIALAKEYVDSIQKGFDKIKSSDLYVGSNTNITTWG